MIEKIKQSNVNDLQLNVSNLNNGVYIVRLVSNDGAYTLSERFVK